MTLITAQLAIVAGSITLAMSSSSECSLARHLSPSHTSRLFLFNVAPTCGDSSSFLTISIEPTEIWVAPLRSDEKKLFDSSQHPFWKRAEMHCFLAVSGGKVCGPDCRY